MTCQQSKHPRTVIGHNLLLLTLLVFGGVGLSACGGGQKEDPLVATYPLAYVKKEMPTAANNLSFESALDPAPMNPSYGSTLIIRDAAVIGAKETTIAPPLSGTGMARRWDVKDLEFSDDGSKLLFAAHLEPLTAGDIQKWDIYEYTRATGQVTPVIQNHNTAILGDDVSPHYLLDGKIIFSSNRNATTSVIQQNQGSQLGTTPVTEGRNGNTLSFKLHVYNNNTADMRQVTFGTSHDLFPSMMRSGRYSGKIIFSRWDTKGDRNHLMHLYMINPDGTNEQYIYGYGSHATGNSTDTIHFTKPMQLGDGRVLSIIRQDAGTYNGGDIVAIDIANFVDIDTRTDAAVTAGVAGRAQASLSAGLGGTQTTLAAKQGKFNSVAPYYDGTPRAIVSYGDCYVIPANSTTPVICTAANIVGGTPYPPLYNIGVYTLGTNELKPLTKPDPAFYYSDVAIAQDKTQPANVSGSFVDSYTGILHIRQVRPDNDAVAKYIRIYKHAYMDNNVANTPEIIGVAGKRSFKMRELIGYAKVQPDGSVRVRVPANVPLSFQLVNANYERIGTSATDRSTDHETWFTVRAGEERTCNGCHVNNTTAHGRSDAEVIPNPGITNAQTLTVGDPIPEMNPDVDPALIKINIATYPVNSPSLADCRNQAGWSGLCRVIIDYDSHIHPFWSVAASDGRTCVTCHNPLYDFNMDMIPDGAAGGLDLSDGTANALPNYTAYTNLLNIAITPGNAATGNAASSNFFGTNNSRFGDGTMGTGDPNHDTRLTAGQIKLIKEWIDNGAQYQNHP